MGQHQRAESGQRRRHQDRPGPEQAAVTCDECAQGQCQRERGQGVEAGGHLPAAQPHQQARQPQDQGSCQGCGVSGQLRLRRPHDRHPEEAEGARCPLAQRQHVAGRVRPQCGEAGSRHGAAVDGRDRVADADAGARGRAIGIEQHHVAPAGDEHAQAGGLAEVKRGRDAGHRHEEREQSQPHLHRGDAPGKAQMGERPQPGTPRVAWGGRAR